MGRRVARSTCTCTVPDGRNRAVGLRSPELLVTLLLPRRVTDSPTTAVGTGSEVPAPGFADPRAQHGAVIGSMSQVVSIHALIAVSEQLVVHRVVEVAEHVVVGPPESAPTGAREICARQRLIHGRQSTTRLVDVRIAGLSWKASARRYTGSRPLTVSRLDLMSGPGELLSHIEAAGCVIRTCR